MRKQFLGHFKEPDETVKKLWQNATFVFDANVLLNLYRYSDDTRKDFLRLLKDLKTRAWLPEQAAHEFLNNRTSVIKSQIASYKTALDDAEKLLKSFSGSRAHPFISKGTQKKLDSAVDQIKAEMEKNKEKQENLIHEDGIKNEIADLFDGQVGRCYTSEELDEVFKEGEERYAAKTPPGYKDGGKIQDPKSESDKRKNFGDWIIWQQIMDHATSTETPIILVTDDRKEDWWVEESGKTLGPRPELIREFTEITDQKILIYTPDGFLNASTAQLQTQISENSIDEVEAEHSSREEERRRIQPEFDILLKDKLSNMYSDFFPDFAEKKKKGVGWWSSKPEQKVDYDTDHIRRILINISRYEKPNEKLIALLHDANSYEEYLMQCAKKLAIELDHLIETEEEELINENLYRNSFIQRELNNISILISKIKDKIHTGIN